MRACVCVSVSVCLCVRPHNSKHETSKWLKFLYTLFVNACNYSKSNGTVWFPWPQIFKVKLRLRNTNTQKKYATPYKSS